MNRIRFHLGRGKNFMHWQVTGCDQIVRYYDPATTRIVMSGAVLRNRRKAAEKIFEGSNKEVVAWLEADHVTIHVNPQPETLTFTTEVVRYNPRIAPHWMRGEENVDGMKFAFAQTNNRTIRVH